MNHTSSGDPLAEILVCPDCAGTLAFQSDGSAVCRHCDLVYPRAPGGVLDLRLKKSKSYCYEFRLGTALLPTADIEFDALPMNPQPSVDFSNVDVPMHLSKEIMSYFPKASRSGSIALDLGCGSAVHRAACQRAGFTYVGLDYDSNEASVLGDAHALPLRGESVDFILSIAVLEHIRFPFICMREAYRVLKPGGSFIGTVAFLEPFHGDSYYHHTHLGTFNSLQEGGFEIQFVSPSKEWHGLAAQANMALFPRMPRRLSRALVMPLVGLHRAWWWLGRISGIGRSESERLRRTTGAFYFVARKREAP